MGISLRGFTGGEFGPSLTETSLSFSLSSGWAPTGPQPGDLILVAGTLSAAGVTVSQTGGTGDYSFSLMGGYGPGGLSNFIAYRVFTPADTDPTFSWGSASQAAFLVLAYTPDAGNVMNVDALAASNPGGADNTFPSPSLITTNSDDVSVVFSSAVTSVNGANTITETPPYLWTTPLFVQTTGDASDVNCYTGSSNAFTGIDLGIPAGGTVAPGNDILACAVTVYATIWQVLIRQDPIGYAPGNGPPVTGYRIG